MYYKRKQHFTKSQSLTNFGTKGLCGVVIKESLLLKLPE